MSTSAGTAPATPVAATRHRNRRGEGERLREEILDAAAALLEETGSEDAVTLRAVARRVGIAAPSIYAHFPDLTSIHDALEDRAFRELITALRAATDPIVDPAVRLRAGCAAYLGFAAERPQRYRALFCFDGPGTDCGDLEGLPPGGSPLDRGLEAFQELVDGVADCIASGDSASDDARLDATALWLALHGFATLTASATAFPWPDLDQLLDLMVGRLAQLRPAGPEAVRG